MSNLVQRVVNLLKSPKTEWPVIAAEPATIADLYTRYALILAAIGPVATLLGGGGFGFFRFSSGFLFQLAIWSYVQSLIMVGLLALIIDALAPTFGAQKDQLQAFKTSIYAYTAAWVAGIGSLIPGLGMLIGLAGAIYSIYLLYTALPHTMKVPAEKQTTYTVVIIVSAIVATLVLGWVSSWFMGPRMFGAFAGGPSVSQTQVFDQDSPLGRLEAIGREMERAEREGRTQDPAQAMGAVMGAFGAGSAEALPVDTLKGFVPDRLAGLPRQSISAERTAAMGMQIATARASFGEGEEDIDLEILDTGGAAALMGLAGWAGVEHESEQGARTERTRTEGGRMVHEVWDSDDNRGEYSVILGQRFVVKVEGRARSLNQLKDAVRSVDLARLESMRDVGRKSN